ncbi:MAG TPA: prepilin peptidase [Micromonosporaceae bacterium]
MPPFGLASVVGPANTVLPIATASVVGPADVVLTVGLASVVGLVGAVLTPLLAYRFAVPAGAPVRSTCTGCARPLPAGPAGWIRVDARCVHCGVRWGGPGWLAAVAGAVASGLLAATVRAPELLLLVALVVLGVLLARVDLACRRLPHQLVAPAGWVSLATYAALAAGTGGWDRLLRAGAGAAVLAAVYLFVFLLPGGGLGFGDVKLATLLGLHLGWLGWSSVLYGAVLPWLINGPVVLALLLAGRVGRKSALPFGPALLTGALVAAVAPGLLASPG